MEQIPQLKKDEYRLIRMRHDSFVEYVESDIFGNLFNKLNEEIEGTDEYFDYMSDHAGVVGANIEKETCYQTIKKCGLIVIIYKHKGVELES